MINRDAEKTFDVKSLTSSEMDSFVQRCANIYQGRPEWIARDSDIRTINFAKSICSETARLTTLAISVSISGSARGDWLQKQIDKRYFDFREWVEYAAAFGTVVLKPNGAGLDVFAPGKFMITSTDDAEKPDGMVFFDEYMDTAGQVKKYYTRMEYHRFVDTKEGRQYLISNRAFMSHSPNSVGDPINLLATKWSNLAPDVAIVKGEGETLEKPLFGILKAPQANNIEIASPLGLPVFAEALEELRDLDIAYTRNATEIRESDKIVLLDSDRLVPSGGRVKNTLASFQQTMEDMKLPKYIRNVYGDGKESFYQEINPTLNTEQRLTGINALLSQIGYKCGFSNGYFAFNEKTGMVTATQVESDDRRTIQFIKDWRDKLEAALTDAIYALNIMADLYGYAPVGEYEVVFDFGDITYNREEDRARWWKYVVANKVPAWMYFVKFEGFAEDEAKAMVKEAEPKELSLFGGEE